MKFKITLVLMVCTLFLTGCSNSHSLVPEGIVNFDINHLDKNDQDKYNDLKDMFKDIKGKKLFFGTTSTANIFDNLGFDVAGAPQSPDLNKDLQEKQVDIKKYKEGTVLNLGSALSLNTEAIIKSNPDLFIYADGMNMTSTKYDILKDKGIKVVALPQSQFEDIFLLMESIKDSGTENSKFKSVYKEMQDDLQYAKDTMKNGTKKKVAIIQASGSVNYSSGNDTLVGSIASSLNIDNIFSDQKSSELNVEKLIEQDPDVIIFYTHFMGDENSDAEFLKYLKEDQLKGLKAIKNNKVIKLGNKDYKVSSSADLNVTKLMKQLTDIVYK